MIEYDSVDRARDSLGGEVITERFYSRSASYSARTRRL